MLCAIVAPGGNGCTQRERENAPPRAVRIYVLAPVVNLSGSEDFDPLKLTDLIASEFLSFEGVAVVPVNLALAELARRGRSAVETPEEARELARALGADAAVVIGVTEYDPYDPPVVGLVVQCYPVAAPGRGGGLDPVSASRSASLPARLSAAGTELPVVQVQRVFNAADERVLADIRSFARKREGAAGPYGWQRYVKSQELYVRYCGHAVILSMLSEEAGGRAAREQREAQS